MWTHYLTQILLFASLAVTVNLLVGYAGQVSVAHAAFVGLGGYTVGFLCSVHDVPFLAGLVVGALLSALIGTLLGLVALGLSEEYLILMTLAFSLALVGILATFDVLGGTTGLTGIDGLAVFGWQLDTPGRWLVPATVVLVLVFAICWRLGESPYGRVLKGIREDATATQALGKNVFAFKLSVFAITSALAGLIGGVYSGWLGLATPGAFGFPLALTIFAIVIFGGTANLVGSVLAAAILTLVEPVLRQGLELESSVATLWQLTIYGVLLIVLMVVRPEGLLRERLRPVPVPPEKGPENGPENGPEHAAEPAGRRPPLRLVQEPVDPLHDWHAAEVVLETEGLGKRFGGIVAANELSLQLRQGTITALVGPNGAGKTTTFNLLTGFVAPDTGSIRLHGQEISGRTPNQIAGLGVVRTFQDVRLLQRVTCLENVMLAVQQKGEHLSQLFLPGRGIGRDDHAVAEKALHWLDYVGMADAAGQSADSLSYGQSKLVSLARALATEADVLLLDEPASGVDHTWVDRMLQIVADVRDQGRTICLVEHNLDVVRELADHTYFMELGEITASGSVDELTGSARLTEAYFGAQ